MVKVAVIGIGKMGISHLSILGAHPQVEVVGVCDASKMVLDVFKKYSSFPCFTEYQDMLEEVKPDAVFVAVPTRFHVPIVKYLLQKRVHVFAEKPLGLNAQEGKELVALARDHGLINQVGYHNRFVGTFQEVKRLVDGGFLGKIFHFTGEAYGPVVVRAKLSNWRSDPSAGGGCLMEYASHVIDLIHYILGPIEVVKGAMLKSIYSRDVDDAVYALLELSANISGVLSVNWSDETYRKMSTSITIVGDKGKIIGDSSELKVYFKSTDCPGGYTAGWNVKYITDVVQPVDFYLRGEEYSSQVDYFIKAVRKLVPNTINNFESAWKTDEAISLIKQNLNH